MGGEKPYIDKKGRRHNWTEDLKEKLLLSESACRLGGVPVQKDEEYTAEIYSRDFGGYYYVYDRTNQIKIFEIEEMGNFYFVSETARELLNIKRVTKKTPKLGLFSCGGRWEAVYDLANAIEKGYEILKEQPDLKETALISLRDLGKIEITSEEFMKTPREIKCFYYTGYHFRALYDVKEERKYKAWRMRKLFGDK
ncbi:hypothetical protein [Bacillus sp. BML-BC060]|uniref:hypothetical protein n=1 Tax=Bacillus sp. BML-BC060 TaxID=2842487 RepID=UPI001C81A107|nr:hypothetical protein [Bacillus sp. BML-BC060]